MKRLSGFITLIIGMGLLLSFASFGKATSKKGKRWVFVPVVPHTKQWNKNNATLECSFYNSTAVYSTDYSRDNKQVLTITTMSPAEAEVNGLHQKGGGTSQSVELALNQSYTKEFIGATFPKGLIITARNQGEGQQGTISGSRVFSYREGSNLFTYPVPVNGGEAF